MAATTAVIYQPAEIETIEKITADINKFKGNQIAIYEKIITQYPLPNQCTKINQQIRLHTWYLLDSVIVDLTKIINFAINEFTTIYAEATTVSAAITDQEIHIGNDKTINRKKLSIEAVTTNIYILPLDFKKELTQQDYNRLLSPNSEALVDSGLINSGLCTNTDIYNRNIFIYRSCEMGFVLLHELIHNYNIEYLFMDNRGYAEINSYLTKTFQIEHPLSTESGTDALAHVLWLKYLYKHVYLGKLDLFQTELEKINDMTERRAINMISLFIEISKSRHATDLPNIIIKESTGAFEYFVVKLSLLRYIGYGKKYLFEDKPMPLNIIIGHLLPKLQCDISQMIIEASKSKFPLLPLSLNRSLI